MRLGLRSVLSAPGAARWLAFGLSGCLFFDFLLMSSLPAVLDFWQQLSYSVDVLFTPNVERGSTGFYDLRGRYFFGSNVAGQSSDMYP